MLEIIGDFFRMLAENFGELLGTVMEKIIPAISSQAYVLVSVANLETLAMVLFSTLFSVLIGLPLGVLLCVTDPVNGIIPKRVLNSVLNRIVDVLRSFPFLILMILLLPLARFIIGTAIGTAATIVPLLMPSR